MKCVIILLVILYNFFPKITAGKNRVSIYTNFTHLKRKVKRQQYHRFITNYFKSQGVQDKN